MRKGPGFVLCAVAAALTMLGAACSDDSTSDGHASMMEADTGTTTSADTDTVVASAKAYVHALNRLIVRREKVGGSDVKEVSYKSPAE